jgi:hypothetical protein
VKTIVPAALLAGLLFGCASPVPFRAAAPVAVDDADPVAVAERFGRAVPDDFHLLSSVVFEYNWFSVSGIGYLDVDTTAGRYKVVCMNHLGVKILEFEGDRNGLAHKYVIEPLARQGDIASVVAEDIKRIYLDLVPSPDARMVKRRQAILFRQRSGDGALEYEFSGEGLPLTSKTYREDHRAVWRVSYYEHRSRNGRLYPMGIVLSNYRNGYRLIVRQKEIRE